MILQFLIVFSLGVAVGVGLCYQVITELVQHGIDTGKIEFKVKSKGQ